MRRHTAAELAKLTDKTSPRQSRTAAATIEDTGSQVYGQAACRALDTIAAHGKQP
ncbi:MAG: hypothetical protein WBF51_04005 [Candidatus Dormiibacterota bacterium]